MKRKTNKEIATLRDNLISYDEALKKWNRYYKLNKDKGALERLIRSPRPLPSGLTKEALVKRIWSFSREIKTMERGGFS